MRPRLSDPPTMEMDEVAMNCDYPMLDPGEFRRQSRPCMCRGCGLRMPKGSYMLEFRYLASNKPNVSVNPNDRCWDRRRGRYCEVCVEVGEEDGELPDRQSNNVRLYQRRKWKRAERAVAATAKTPWDLARVAVK